MELRHLRYFVAVAEELNFTRAAERLHLGQPPLSMQIRDLEAELGVRLFERNRRRVRLTEAGERFLERARQLLASASAAVEEARQMGRGEAGCLRVGFTSSVPYTSIMPDLLLAYSRRYPGVELQLTECFTLEQLLALDQGELDVGLVRYVGGEIPESIEVREIGRDALRLVINSAHPLAQQKSIHFSQLAQESFITFPPGVGTGLPAILNDLCRRAGFEPRIVQRAREATTQIGLVAAGLGLALLPEPLSCVAIPRVRYLPIEAEEDVYFSLSVAVRRQGQSPQIQGFLEVLSSLA